MNIHKNARTTPQSRAVLVHRVLREHWPVSAVAIAFGVSERTVYKWLARYRAEGLAGLRDRALDGASPSACPGAGLVGSDPPAAAGQAGGRRDRRALAAGALDGERGTDTVWDWVGCTT